MVSAANCLWELYHLRPRSPRAKVVALSVIGSITVLLMLLSPFQVSPGHHGMLVQSSNWRGKSALAVA